METLEERYRDDPGLLEFYKRKLLRRGWAGCVDKVEKEYIRRAKRAGYSYRNPPPPGWEG